MGQRAANETIINALVKLKVLSQERSGTGLWDQDCTSFLYAFEKAGRNSSLTHFYANGPIEGTDSDPQAIVIPNGRTLELINYCLRNGLILQNGQIVDPKQQTPQTTPSPVTDNAPTPDAGQPAGGATPSTATNGNPIIQQIQQRLYEMGYLGSDDVTGVIATEQGEPKADDMTIMALREFADNAGVSLGDNLMPSKPDLDALNRAATATPPHRNPEPSWTMESIAGRPFAYYESADAFLTGIGVRSTKLFGSKLEILQTGGIYGGGQEVGRGQVATGVGHILGGIVETTLALPAVGLEFVDRFLKYHELRSSAGIRSVIKAARFFVGIARFVANLVSAVGQVAGFLIHGAVWLVIKPFELLTKWVLKKVSKSDSKKPVDEKRRLQAEIKATKAEIALRDRPDNNAVQTAYVTALKKLLSERVGLAELLAKDSSELTALIREKRDLIRQWRLYADRLRGPTGWDQSDATSENVKVEDEASAPVADAAPVPVGPGAHAPGFIPVDL